MAFKTSKFTVVKQQIFDGLEHLLDTSLAKRGMTVQCLLYPVLACTAYTG